MKTMKSGKRRKFLITAGFGGAGIATAIVAGTHGKGTIGAETADGAKPGGYRVSEHILKYYKTTEV